METKIFILVPNAFCSGNINFVRLSNAFFSQKMFPRIEIEKIISEEKLLSGIKTLPNVPLVDRRVVALVTHSNSFGIRN